MNKLTAAKLCQTVLATGTLILALGNAARAADVPQAHVKYADLDLSSPAGAKVLYQRIRVAASLVCGTADQRDLARFEQAKTCADKAIAGAVTAVGNDTLTDLYQAKTHNVTAVKFASN